MRAYNRFFGNMRYMRFKLLPELEIAGILRAMKYRLANKSGRIVKTGSESERKFIEKHLDAGYEIYKKGWPDFVIVKGSDIRFIEVKKSKFSSFSQAQFDIAKILQLFKIEIEHWYPGKE